jgi:predicted dehydrogenase
MERRDFLKTGLTAAAAAAPFAGRVRGANERVGVGIIGLGPRGNYELETFLKFKEAEVRGLSEVYQPLLDRGLAKAGSQCKGYADFRKMLESKDIDVVVVATPDHWHAPATILACQAGKDVLCEKPLTHTIHEGRVMVEAARKHKRIVQTGSQQRSSTHFKKVVEMIRGGYIGEISSIVCWNTGNSWPTGTGKPPDTAPPAGMNWDLYLGPAPKVPYNRNRHTWNYRWFWDYSGGMVTDWGAHHLDVVHWAMDVDAPESASAFGGRYCVEDNCETPNTVSTIYQYPGFVVEYQVRGTNSYDRGERPYGMAFYGTKGTIVIDRASWEVIPEKTKAFGSDIDRVEAYVKTGSVSRPVGYDSNAKFEPKPLCEAASESGIAIYPQAQDDHVQDFLDCVKSRKLPVADVEIGHRSATACHVGVIAYRLGRTVRWDGKKEAFLGDKQAQSMTTKEYRRPYVLPAV